VKKECSKERTLEEVVSGARNSGGERCQQQWRKRCRAVAEANQNGGKAIQINGCSVIAVVEAKAREK